MDYGKYKYDKKKKQHQHGHHTKTKEIRLRPKTGEHDIDFKVKKAIGFLQHKDKVQVSVLFRGREMAHPELGMKLLNKVQADFDEIAKVEFAPKMEGRQMIMILAPR